MKAKYLFYPLLTIGLIFACSDDDGGDPAIQLVANAGADQTVSPGTLVTLDGSASTGPEGFIYEWRYLGSEQINLSSTTQAVVTFIPPVTNSYQFQLNITSNGKFSTSLVTVTVEGSIELSVASFTEDQLILGAVNSGGVDYLVNQDFEIPVGKRLTVQEGATIAFAPSAGIIVKGTLIGSSGTLTASDNTSWKGVLIDGGSVSEGSGLNITQAGGQVFDGQNEAAAVTLINGGMISNNVFISEGVSEVGILYDASASSSAQGGSISISGHRIPAKLPVGLVHLTDILFADSYDYFEIVTLGASVTEGSIMDSFTFENKDFYLTDGFTAGSPVVISNATLFFSEDRGMVGASVITIGVATLQGLDGANWKGVASTEFMTIGGATIDGAGSSTHNTGSFTTPEPAALYGGRMQLTSTQITNSQGAGVYLVTDANNSITITNNDFENNAGYDINAPASLAVTVIGNNTWIADTPVLLRGGNVLTGVTINDLGEGKSYLVEGDLNVLADMTIMPGVTLKFQADKGMSVSSRLIAEGDSQNPITFDGEAGSSGSWKGIELLGLYALEFCTITNGGSSAFTGQNAANIIFGGGEGFLTPPQANYQFDNNTVSNSAGAGSEVKLSKFNPLIDNSTNTFDNNASQDSDGDGTPDDSEIVGCENDPDC